MDLSKTIIPKSDQLNADDLVAGSRVIKIREVKITESEQQPVSIFFDGDNNKPFKPCKSMLRLMVKVWGVDGTKYTGHSMRIYRDDNVVYAGQAVGGIRISHMTGITEPMDVLVTISKNKRRPYTVQPLVIELTPDHPKWAAAKKAIQDKTTTIEKVQSKYTISEANIKLLTND